MREFIVWAQAAPVRPDRFRGVEGQRAHVGILAHCLMNGLFVAKGHRTDTRVHLVLERGAAPLTLSFDGAAIGDIGGFGETSLLECMGLCLDLGAQLAPGSAGQSPQGVWVKAAGLTALIRDGMERGPLFVLSRRGMDIRTQALDRDCRFLLTDHVAMPSRIARHLGRLGAQRLSLGPKMLFASQCISVIHNELDRRVDGMGPQESAGWPEEPVPAN